MGTPLLEIENAMVAYAEKAATISLANI